MYEEFFGFSKKPFSIVPDPYFFFLSEGHKEALAHLVYGIKSDGGFVLLTGDIGAGKTTACRRLLEQLPEEIDVAIIFNPKLTVEELLATICDEFGIPYPEGNLSIKVFIDRINEFLLNVRAKGRQAVLILEEAQNLKPEVLEQIRLLTNLETNEHKLLQMIMIGQPELNDLLAQPQLRQLSERVTARYHLGPLSKKEIPLYIDYRLSEAGVARGLLFSPGALKKLFRLSRGIPRLINVICDRALLGAYVQGKDRVDRKTLITAAREVFGEEGRWGRKWWLTIKVPLGVSLLGLLFLGAAFSLYHYVPWPLEAVKPAPSPSPVIKKALPPVSKEPLKPVNALSAEGTMRSAYSALFKKWQIVFDPHQTETVCEQAKKQKLQCYLGKASLTNLRHLNKPAVLTLKDEKKGDYYGFLSALDGQSALLTVGQDTKIMDHKELAKQWSGNYLILWRVPPEFEKDLNLGGKGPLLPWVEKHLALAEGRPIPETGEEVYGEALMTRVKKFQQAAGFIPDGIVGPKTVIALSALSGKGEPVLFTKKGGE